MRDEGRMRAGGRGEGCNAGDVLCEYGLWLLSSLLSVMNAAGRARAEVLRTISADMCRMWLGLAANAWELCCRLHGDVSRLLLLLLSIDLFSVRHDVRVPSCVPSCHKD